MKKKGLRYDLAPKNQIFNETTIVRAIIVNKGCRHATTLEIAYIKSYFHL